MLMVQDTNIVVKEMISAMQTTIDFEGKLDKRFTDHTSNTTKEREGSGLIRGKFQKFISSCFEPYLDYYIKSEDQYTINYCCK